MSGLSVLKRSSIFFYLSFFTAGTQSIITQLFFKNLYPSYKEILLPATLILGATAYICGILISGRLLEAPSYMVRYMFIVNILAFICMLIVKRAWLYMILYMISCFSCNFVFNYCDHCFLKNGHKDVGHHVKVMLVFQMLAYILSPVFFSIYAGNTFICISFISFIAIIIGIFTFSELTFQVENSAMPGEKSKEPLKPKHLDINAKLFIIYVVVYLSIVSIAISMVAYFTSEYYMLSDYAIKSGILLMLMSASAGIAVVFYRNKFINIITDECSIDFKTKLFRPGMQISIIIITFIMTILLLFKLSASFLYMAFILSVMGAGYGLLLSSSRKFAAIVSIRERNPGLLSIYNNLQSVALLMGYTASSIIWGVSIVLKSNFYLVLIVAILIMLLIEIIIVLLWLWFINKKSNINILYLKG